jgi:glycosyltransferase involved in cell wall biosynthesis
VLDVFDDPYQLIYHNPLTYHEVGVRLVARILNRAERAVYTVHPSTPHTFGKEKRFAVNGADVSGIEPRERSGADDSLRGVCAGVKGGMDVLLRALQKSGVDIEVDVYGSISPEDERLANELGLGEHVTFHGPSDHDDVTRTIEEADVGFCLLPRKTDWYYAHPIKIGEYLAGGTIPMGSAYPGIRQLARDVGIYVENDAESVAEKLTHLSEHSDHRTKLQSRCRQRAAAIDWRDERAWFARQALERVM